METSVIARYRNGRPGRKLRAVIARERGDPANAPELDSGAPRGSGKIKENGYIQRDRLQARE